MLLIASIASTITFGFGGMVKMTFLFSLVSFALGVTCIVMVSLNSCPCPAVFKLSYVSLARGVSILARVHDEYDLYEDADLKSLYETVRLMFQ